MIEKDTVIVTEQGNIIAKAGDLLDNVDVGTTVLVHKINGIRADEKQHLRKVLTPERLIVVSKGRAEPVSVDMDSILPREVLNKRKRLIKQRMEQERNR
ncbi:MAG: hypothetical protein DRQ41_11610 [Gammaproteobacteria bacterium]|nr:MAG: hypothetical protein DRQ41_11610 [Gammaproteobacteria bacterium]